MRCSARKSRRWSCFGARLKAVFAPSPTGRRRTMPSTRCETIATFSGCYRNCTEIRVSKLGGNNIRIYIGENHAKVRNWASSTRREQDVAGGVENYVAAVLQRAKSTRTADSVGPKLRHGQQDLLHLHRSERRDGTRARASRRVSGEPGGPGQNRYRPDYVGRLIPGSVVIKSERVGGRKPSTLSSFLAVD